MKPGDVALVRFPFADLAATKKRPALVLARTVRSPRNRIATVAMITSQVEGPRLDGDVELSDWKKAGLLHPSVLRLAKIATIDEELIDKVIGTLTATDMRASKRAFQERFAHWQR